MTRGTHAGRRRGGSRRASPQRASKPGTGPEATSDETVGWWARRFDTAPARKALAIAAASFAVGAIGLVGTVDQYLPGEFTTAATGGASDTGSARPLQGAPARDEGSNAGRPPVDATTTPTTAEEPEPEPTPSQTPTPTPTPTKKAPIVIPERASGHFTVAAVDPESEERTAAASGSTMTYRVEMEKGLPYRPEEFATIAHEKLTDERGWEPIEDIAFRRTESADFDFRLVLASPKTTDKLCAPLDTGGEVSCRNGDNVVLNAKRWAYAVPAYKGKLDAYRGYLTNHEVGHRLGYDHARCGGKDEPAPIMMQQTKGIDECRPNPWPSVKVD